ncbi:hypothetical protein ACFQ3Q_13270 [Salegentibacter chungangensis]|uniref:Vitellogenin II n=2 Tax=Salegentibacter chungangensis TaxID=1335724 RepID=A0ABW3NVI1_9FLAO
MVPVLLLLLASCGSYQYSGYENDGIYGDTNGERPAEYEQSQNANQQKETNRNSYYKNLFAEKSAMYGELAEGAIFTDVEDYSSSRDYEDEEYQEDQTTYSGGYAPWGNDPDQITINFYDNGFYSPWYYTFYNPYYYPYYGYNYWGSFGYPAPFPGHYTYWHNRFGYRGYYGHPYWGSSIGFGFGFTYNPFFRYNYGRYFGSHFYSNYHRLYSYRNVAYNTGRRNSYSDYSNANQRRTAYSDARSRNSSYSRKIREIRDSRSSGNYDSSRRRSAVRSSDNNTRTYSRTSRRTESPRTYRSSNQRRSSDYNRSSRSSRSERNYSPSRSTRSSSSVRSSGSSSRSSGSSSGSSGRRSSRGGGRN